MHQPTQFCLHLCLPQNDVLSASGVPPAIKYQQHKISITEANFSTAEVNTPVSMTGGQGLFVASLLLWNLPPDRLHDPTQTTVYLSSYFTLGQIHQRLQFCYSRSDTLLANTLK